MKGIYYLTNIFFTLTPRTDGITAYGFRLIFMNPFTKKRSLKEKKRKCLTPNLRHYHGGKLSHWLNWARLSPNLSSG